MAEKWQTIGCRSASARRDATNQARSARPVKASGGTEDHNRVHKYPFCAYLAMQQKPCRRLASRILSRLPSFGQELMLLADDEQDTQGCTAKHTFIVTSLFDSPMRVSFLPFCVTCVDREGVLPCFIAGEYGSAIGPSQNDAINRYMFAIDSRAR